MRQAAIAAGIVKVPSRVEQAKALIAKLDELVAKLDEQERQQLIEWRLQR